MRILFFLFVLIPIAEIMLLIEVGDHIGGLNTVALVLLTAIIGAGLLRKQGLDTLLRANQRMAQGEIPIKEMLSGIVLAVGGALLLTPGFITDALGFLCLLPLTRGWAIEHLIRKGVMAGGSGYASFSYSSQGQAGPRPAGPKAEVQREVPGSHNTTIEGEYRRED
ncbi:FxsA family protein [Dasania sp. GY-MA-18]|uniref:FxsA family protein n=1 Tax=Dasania phycosphaerae TaxID=2950436 RepID=A0A9J6RPX9_9GAMM|nr:MULTISPECIES: FxsA family protein [Dasania]MCR8923643.1 FxsA family protein [Dasania sp. GY-MA-18]MCZ0866077.1 FxsA family protein [Dasania phycosphaerae]MCZ0869801.1 FxsA family protein [Dasania phycosphaerae]